MSQNLTFNLNVDTNTAVSSINEFFNTFDAGAARASSKLRQAFNEPIKTEVEISLKNGELVAKKIESSKDKAKQLKDIYRALNGQIGKTPNALKKQMSILKALQGNTKKYRNGTNKLTQDWKKVEAAIKKVKAAQDRLSSGGGGGGIDNFIGKFAMVQTIANLGTAAIMDLGRSIGDLAATGVRMESLMLQLESFTGSSQAAKEVYEEFADTARKTPFNVEEVANAGKIMMAFGVDTDTAAKMTDRLAIAAAATGGDVNNLARNLGQIAAQGQAYTRDLHQFAMQGLPIWDEMSKVTGKSVVELKKLASEGQISFSIVSKAIKNMTAEGTAFAENAKRMEETFAGRMAQIQTGATNLALGMIQAFNNFDKELGGILGGAMLGFAQALEGLAEKMPAIGAAAGKTLAQIGGIFSFVGNVFKTVSGFLFTMLSHFVKVMAMVNPLVGIFQKLGGALLKLTKPLQDAGLLLAALAGPAIVVGIGLIIKSIYGMVTATYAYVKAQIVSLGLMGPKGWMILAGAGAATAASYMMLKGNLEEANKEMEASATEQEKNAAAAESNAASQEILTESIDDTTSALKKQGQAAKLAADTAKQEYDAAKRQSDALKTSILNRIRDEKSAIDDKIEYVKEKIDQEKEAYKSIKENIKQRYADEKQQISEIYDAKLAALDLERDQLQARTPAEEKLRQLQKQELEDKLNSADLSEKERLEIEARLERMQRQEKLEKLAAERKEVEANKAKELKKLESQKAAELGKQKAIHEKTLGALENQVKKLEASKKALDDKAKSIKDLGKGTETYNGNLDKGIARLKTMLAQTQSLKEEWKDLAAIANQAKLDAAAAKADSQSAGGTPVDGALFTGGPVTGGSTYQVNELGKEAFLSASGKLSMINAPAFGHWKAPGAGTVIPAHLTKQLDVPTGGVNLNSAAVSNASRAGSGGMGSMVKAIRGAMNSGDTFHQNVTVQSSNPTQTANNMMVEMTRLRRRGLR